MEVRKLFEEHQRSFARRVDRAFAWLMIAQWGLTIILSVTVSPYSQGNEYLQLSAGMTALIGGLISAPALYFAFLKAGHPIGRFVMAFSQMGFTSLFIHLMGGSLEAHFHLFGSLAFLATYRDWRVLPFASVIIIVDHIIRGIYAPLTVYGVPSGAEWRWVEHTAWIAFEVIFLVYTCIHATREMWKIALTNWKLMHARLAAEKLNIKRTQFFSVISHEIRTPLNGIIGFSDFLTDSPIPEEQKEYVGIIKQCSDTLLKLINDLLDFSKIDGGHLDIDPHRFKVREIIDYLENVFLLECQKKNLEFRVEVSPDVPEELVGDSHRIRQVLSNIVGNAIKFTESGSICICLKRTNPDQNIYRWDVKDTGMGIKKDNLDKIFSPYTQEFSHTARKYGGSGLGLAISKKLVELMGGQLFVESSVGKGTNFYFTIPLKLSAN